MKIFYFVLSLVLVIILSCNGHKGNNVIPIGIVKDTPIPKEEKEIISLSILDLQGIWAEKEEENALFYIKNDSLYYTENQNNPISIKLYGDTLLIMGEVPVHCKVLKLTGDSLWYKDEFNETLTKLYKR